MGKGIARYGFARASRPPLAGAAPARIFTSLVAIVMAAAIAIPATAAARPNVVLIVTDDQTAQSFNQVTMPRTVRLLANRGTSFSDAVVATPQCCPSRATMLTGQYDINHGVIANEPGYSLLRQKANTLPAWLSRAGYTTAHVGKYLNHYEDFAGTEPAPGWDRWFSLLAADYRNPSYSVDGKRRKSGKGEYVTRRLSSVAARMIEGFSAQERPFFLQLNQLAPHIGGASYPGRCNGAPTPDPRDEDLFLDEPIPQTPAFNEADVSDKPHFMQAQAQLSARQVEKLQTYYGCSLATLRAVDRGTGRVVAALRKEGQLDNTLIIFTSDNGFSFGDHRVPDTKGLPYEEHLRVPLVIRAPGDVGARTRGESLESVVANVDLAPTILDFAAAKPCLAKETCRRMDGRSLRTLLRGQTPRWESDRAIRISFNINAARYGLSCAWEGLRTSSTMLVEHVSAPGEYSEGNTCVPASIWERYDLTADPFQLDNLGLPADDPQAAGLAARLESLRFCSGIKGDVKPLAGRPFCE